MSEMQSDTALVATDTQSTDDTTRSSDAVANDNVGTAVERQPAVAGEVMDTSTEVRTANDADNAASSSRELDESVTQHPSTTDIDTDSPNPVDISSTDEPMPSADDDADNVSNPASGPSSSSASVSTAEYIVRVCVCVFLCLYCFVPSVGRHNEYWRWYRSLLGKKRRVLRNSRPCTRTAGILA